MIKVVGIDAVYDLSCHIIADYYVPIKFKSYEDIPVPMLHVRFGDYKYSLLDILVESDTSLIRGFTLVSFSAAQIKQLRVPELRKQSTGLPIVELNTDLIFSGRVVKYTDVPKDFSVCLQSNAMQIAIGDFSSATEKTSFGRVDFLTDSELLLGFQVNNLTADEKSEIAHFFDKKDVSADPQTG